MRKDGAMAKRASSRKISNQPCSDDNVNTKTDNVENDAATNAMHPGEDVRPMIDSVQDNTIRNDGSVIMNNDGRELSIDRNQTLSTSTIGQPMLNSTEFPTIIQIEHAANDLRNLGLGQSK